MSAEPASKYVWRQPPVLLDRAPSWAEVRERERLYALLYALLDTLANFAAFYAEPLPDLPPTWRPIGG